MADVLIRIDCPHCGGELIVAASDLEDADSRLFCEGCAIRLDFAPEPAPGRRLATEGNEIRVRLRWSNAS